MDLAPGTQIVARPHTLTPIFDYSSQFGFVVSKSPKFDAYFCRYWVRGQEGIRLRTLSVSELTNAGNLTAHVSCDQSIVDKLLLDIQSNPP